jgi:AcrR family transcriptional regulator
LVQHRQLNREDWLAAARKALIASGIDDVKVERLAAKMRVSRGSFYWHFENRRDLLDALLNDWEVRNHFEMAQIRTRWSRSEPDLSEIVAIWIGGDPNFPSYDMAVRGWARKSESVSEAVVRIDEAWVALIAELFRREDYSEDESFVRARVIYFHQIGYHALGIHEEISERIRLAPLYYKALTGKEPGAKLRRTLDILSRQHRSEPKRSGKRTGGRRS